MKAVISVAALAVGILINFVSAFALPTAPNEVGLYTTPDPYGPTGTSVMGEFVEVHLVLSNPTNPETGLPVNSIETFECQLDFSEIPTDGLIKLSEDIFYGDGFNVGDASSLHDGSIWYAVGFYMGVPVVNESVVLVTMRFLLLTAEEIDVTLSPTDSSSIPGQPCFSEDFNSFQVMHPVSGSPDAPIFRFNGMAVGVENQTFGSVKALYR